MREFSLSPRSEVSTEKCGAECVEVQIEGKKVIFTRDVLPLRDVLDRLSIQGKFPIEAPSELFDSTTMNVDVHSGIYSSLDKFLVTILYGRNIGFSHCQSANVDELVTRLYKGKGFIKFVEGDIVFEKSGKPVTGVYFTTQFECGWYTDEDGHFLIPMDTISVEPLRQLYGLRKKDSVDLKVLQAKNGRRYLYRFYVGSGWAKPAFLGSADKWLLPDSAKIVVNSKSRDLKKVLKQITNQTGYFFMYQPQYVDGVIVNVPKDSLHLKELLSRILKDTQLEVIPRSAIKQTIILARKMSQYEALDSLSSNFEDSTLDVEVFKDTLAVDPGRNMDDGDFLVWE